MTARVEDDRLLAGEHLAISFERTLRIPDDGKTYPLPPGLGTFPVCKVEDYKERVPESWAEHGGVFIPMYQREALWLNFHAPYWRPCAVKVGIGKINAVTGEAWDEELDGTPQDYLVCPDQPWLDGINAGEDYIRQFVAMPQGMGYTVEGQLTGKEEFGGIQILAFGPKPGLFPDKPPRQEFPMGPAEACCAAGGAEMGLGAGGRMRQKIYPDPYGIDVWDRTSSARVYVHIVNSLAFSEITGHEPPPTPVSAKTYAQHGLPWFALYDEGKGDVSPSEKLGEVDSVKDVDAKKGFAPQQDDGPIEVPDNAVVKLGSGSWTVKDGSW
jgi:hypothetical protein